MMKFNEKPVFSHTDSPLGPLLLAATPLGLAGAWFVHGQRATPDPAGWTENPDPPRLRPAAPPPGGHFAERRPVLREAAAQLADYFAGQRQQFALPLDLRHGTVFQRAVWQALLSIPFGQITRYAAVAGRVGRPTAVRALGAAVGRNPISIIVPCHRVIGADGSLTGYAGGLDRKTALLRLEGVL